MAKQKYTEDFKKTIINLNQADSSVEELAHEYGLSPQTIYKWKKLHTPISILKKMVDVIFQVLWTCILKKLDRLYLVEQ